MWNISTIQFMFYYITHVLSHLLLFVVVVVVVLFYFQMCCPNFLNAEHERVCCVALCVACMSNLNLLFCCSFSLMSTSCGLCRFALFLDLYWFFKLWFHYVSSLSWVELNWFPILSCLLSPFRDHCSLHESSFRDKIACLLRETVPSEQNVLLCVFFGLFWYLWTSSVWVRLCG